MKSTTYHFKDLWDSGMSFDLKVTFEDNEMDSDYWSVGISRGKEWQGTNDPVLIKGVGNLERQAMGAVLILAGNSLLDRRDDVER